MAHCLLYPTTVFQKDGEDLCAGLHSFQQWKWTLGVCFSRLVATHFKLIRKETKRKTVSANRMLHDFQSKTPSGGHQALKIMQRIKSASAPMAGTLPSPLPQRFFQQPTQPLNPQAPARLPRRLLPLLRLLRLRPLELLPRVATDIDQSDRGEASPKPRAAQRPSTLESKEPNKMSSLCF